MTVDALAFFGAMISLLWLALAMAVGAVVVAAIWVMSRAISRRLEGRYLPGLSRWSRRRSGLPEDAGPWACPGCRSVNTSTVVACYRCGVARPAGAPELREAATDPGIFHRPAPASQFDPSRYRGPGAPLAAPAASPSPVPAPASPEPPASSEPPPHPDAHPPADAEARRPGLRLLQPADSRHDRVRELVAPLQGDRAVDDRVGHAGQRGRGSGGTGGSGTKEGPGT